MLYSRAPMKARSPLAIIFLTVALDLLGFGLIIPVAPYYAQHFHATETEVALLGTIYSAMQFIFVPVWGRLSDRVGRRPVLLFSILASAVSMAIFGAAQSYGWLLAARAVSGAATANIAVAQAYVADVTTPANRAKGMGLIGAAFGIGFVFGPFAGGQLSSLGRHLGIGYGLVGYGAAALALVNFVLALTLLPESRKPGDSPVAGRASRLAELRQTLTIPGLVGLFVVFFVGTFAFANLEWTFALLTQERLSWTPAVGGDRYNGYVFGFIGVIAAVIQGGLIGRLTRKLGERRLLFIGLALLSAGLAALATVHSLAVLLVACVLFSVGNSLTGPSISSLVSRRAPAESQGGVLGVQQSVGSLGRVIGPTCGGLLFQHAGSAYPFITGAVAMAVALVVALFAVRDA